MAFFFSSLKRLQPMARQQLQKVIKGHLPPDWGLHELTPHFLQNAPQSPISSSLRSLNQALRVRWPAAPSEKAGRETMGEAVWHDAPYLLCISRLEKRYLPCRISPLPSRHRLPFPAITRSKCSPDVSAIKLQYFTTPALILSTVSQISAW